MVVAPELQVQAYHPRTQRQPEGSLLTTRGLTASTIIKAKTAKVHRNVHGTASEGNVQDNREQEEQEGKKGHPKDSGLAPEHLGREVSSKYRSALGQGPGSMH